VCAFAYAYLRLAARACLPRFAYIEHGTAIVYCCSFYYPRVMVARAGLAWPIEIVLPSNSIILNKHAPSNVLQTCRCHLDCQSRNKGSRYIFRNCLSYSFVFRIFYISIAFNRIIWLLLSYSIYTFNSYNYIVASNNANVNIIKK